MPDYRALAQALDDTGTPDAIKMFQSGYKLPNFLGMSASQPTPQEIERMVAEQSPAFGVFPQMKPYRSEQDITASANVPVDLFRGRVAGTRGLFGDVVNQPIPMVRPLQLLSQAFTGQQKYPDTEHYLETMPLKSNTPIGDVAGRIGSFAPINPMPAVRAGQKGLNLLGMEVADRLATGRSVLPSQLKEPQTAMFAVNPTELPTSITNKSEVKNVADDFANQFKQMGFDVTLDHSGSKVGASSYLRVSDPTTGRFLNKPIRISDHSKGAKELDANINVLNPQEDFAKITSILTDMRKMGATLVVKQDKYAQELIANGVNPKTAYQKAKTEITGLPSLQIQDKVLPVTMHKLEEKAGNQIVNISPETFDKAFSKTDWQYVGKGGEGGIKGRYKGFENWLKDAKSMTASNVSVNKDGGIVFGDGRHRYAVLRDMGLDKLPISMDKESIENAKKFGYLAE